MLRLQSYLIYDPDRLKKAYWLNLFGKFALIFVLIIIILSTK